MLLFRWLYYNAANLYVILFEQTE